MRLTGCVLTLACSWLTLTAAAAGEHRVSFDRPDAVPLADAAPPRLSPGLAGRALAVPDEAWLGLAHHGDRGYVGFWLRPEWDWDDGEPRFILRVPFEPGVDFEFYKDDQNRLVVHLRAGPERSQRQWLRTQLDWQPHTWHHLALAWEPTPDGGTVVAAWADGRRVIHGRVTATDRIAAAFDRIHLGDDTKRLAALVDELVLRDEPGTDRLELPAIRRGYRATKILLARRDLGRDATSPADWAQLAALDDAALEAEEHALQQALTDRWLQRNLGAANPPLTLLPVPITAKVRPEPFLNEPVASTADAPALVLHAIRGQKAAGQVMLVPHALAGGAHTLELAALTGPDGAALGPDRARIRRVWCLPVPVENPYPTDQPAQRIPDALLPLAHDKPVAPGELAAYWVDVDVPADQPPGVYQGLLHASSGDARATLPVRLHVHRPVLPERLTLRTAFGLTPSHLASVYDLPTGSEAFRQLVDRFVLNMLDHHMSPKNLYRGDDFTQKREDLFFLRPRVVLQADGNYTVDFTDYDRQIERYLPHGLNTVLVNTRRWAARQRPDDKTPLKRLVFDERLGRERALALEPFGEEYRKFARQTFAAWELHLRQKNWPVTPYSYVVDEPFPAIFPNSGFLSRIVQEVAPSVAFMITSYHDPTPELGKIDILTVRLDTLTDAVRRSLRDSGGTLWLYSCVAPEQPHPGLMLRHAGVDQLIMGWLCYRFDAKGFLYYETAVWLGHNPLERLVPYCHPGGEYAWGDGLLFYPGPDGPWDSVRAELLRIGFEDYELLTMLERRLARGQGEPADRRLLDLTPLIRDMRTYDRGHDPYTQRRVAVLEALDRLIAAHPGQ